VARGDGAVVSAGGDHLAFMERTAYMKLTNEQKVQILANIESILDALTVGDNLRSDMSGRDFTVKGYQMVDNTYTSSIRIDVIVKKAITTAPVPR
jgi:hypothetical protein